jgi:AsmA protein
MRKFGITLGIIVLGVILAVAIFLSTFDINRYRSTIQADLSKHLGRNVTLGQMNLNVFPPRFVVHDVSIADDPSFHTQKPFVTARQLAVSVKLLPLLHKSVEIDSLYLQRPDVELIRNAQGRWNFSSLGKQPVPEQFSAQPAPQPSSPAPRQSAQQPAPQQTASSDSSGQEQFSLSKLAIQDGQIANTDEQTRTPRAVYDHIDITLTDFAPGKPFSVEAAAHLPGPNDQQIRLAGKGGPVQDQPTATPFHGTLDLQRVAISDAKQFVNSPALAKVDGTVSGQTKISSDSGKLAATGDLNIQNIKMNGRDLGYPINAKYNVHDDVPADLLTIDSANIQLGMTPLLINGTVNSKSTPAQINLCLKANNVSMAEVARLAAASGTALTPDATVTGTLDANVEARGSANAPALDGTINGHDIQVSGKDIPQPVQVKEVALNLTPSEIHSDKFNVSSGMTSAAVQAGLQQYTSQNPTINATVQAPNAELPALLSMARAYGVKALDNVNGSGTLNVDLHATGPVRSVNSGNVAQDLNGNIGLNLKDVKYTATDMSHELSTIAGIAGLHQGSQGITTINQMTGNIAIKNGVAQTNNVEALLDIGNVGITGTANLVNQELNLRVSAVMSKELSQKAGGTNIGGYAKTALSNSDGDLVIPATVTGTFQHPKFAPDLQQVAQMKLKGLIPNFNNPAAGVSGLLGNVLKQQGGGNQGQAQQQPQNPVNELKNLFGKKKQQQK